MTCQQGSSDTARRAALPTPLSLSFVGCNPASGVCGIARLELLQGLLLQHRADALQHCPITRALLSLKSQVALIKRI